MTNRCKYVRMFIRIISQGNIVNSIFIASINKPYKILIIRGTTYMKFHKPMSHMNFNRKIKILRRVPMNCDNRLC